MPKVEGDFEFTPSEIKEMLKNPAVLALLMDYHEAMQTEADSIWGEDEGCPQGNILRKRVLYERGRTLMVEDLDNWPDDLRRTFGFPVFG